MEPKVFTSRSSLAGSAARDAESSRASAGSRIESGSAAHAAADTDTRRPRQNDGGFRINLRAQPVQPPPPRLFPGPSARPLAAAAEVAAAVTPVQQAPYPASPQPGTVTSVGARCKRALFSLFA